MTMNVDFNMITTTTETPKKNREQMKAKCADTFPVDSNGNLNSSTNGNGISEIQTPPKDFLELICGDSEINCSKNNKRKFDPDISLSSNGRKKIKNYNEDLIASSEDKGRGKRIRKPIKRSQYLDDYIDEEEGKKIEETDVLDSKLLLIDKSDWRYTRDSGDKTYRPTYRYPRISNNKPDGSIDFNHSNSNSSPVSKSKNNCVNNGDSIFIKSKLNGENEKNLNENEATKLKSSSSKSSDMVKITTLIPTFNGSTQSSQSDSADDISSEQFFVKHTYHQNEVPDNAMVKKSQSFMEEMNENDEIEGLTIIDITISDDEHSNRNIIDNQNEEKIEDFDNSDHEIFCKINNLNKLNENEEHADNNNEASENDNECKIGDMSINTITATEDNSPGYLDESSLSDCDADNKHLPTEQLQTNFQKCAMQLSPQKPLSENFQIVREVKKSESTLTNVLSTCLNTPNSFHPVTNKQKGAIKTTSSISIRICDSLTTSDMKIATNVNELAPTVRQLPKSRRTTKNTPRSKPNKQNTSRTKKDRKKKKYDAFYDEEDEINSKIVNRFVSKQPNKNSHNNNSSCKIDKRKVIDNSHSNHVGPYIHCKGSKDTLSICRVMNVKDSSDADGSSSYASKYSMLSSESCSTKAASRMVANVPWKCIFCCHGSCHMTLGDLYGPYIPQQANILHSPNTDSTKQNNSSKLTAENSNTHKLNSSNNKRLTPKSNDKINLQLHIPANGLPAEMWVHGDCAVWAGGVCVAGGRVKGLEDAALIALNSMCCVCHQRGATVGCMVKGCTQKYHFICGKGAGCAFQEENFSLLCPKHKTKPLRLYKPAPVENIIQTVTLL